MVLEGRERDEQRLQAAHEGDDDVERQRAEALHELLEVREVRGEVGRHVLRELQQQLQVGLPEGPVVGQDVVDHGAEDLLARDGVVLEEVEEERDAQQERGLLGRVGGGEAVVQLGDEVLQEGGGEGERGGDDGVPAVDALAHQRGEQLCGRGGAEEVGGEREEELFDAVRASFGVVME